MGNTGFISGTLLFTTYSLSIIAALAVYADMRSVWANMGNYLGKGGNYCFCLTLKQPILIALTKYNSLS